MNYCKEISSLKMYVPFLFGLLLQLFILNEASLLRAIQKDDSKEHQQKAIAELRLRWQESFKTTDFNNDGIVTLDERDRRIQIFVNIYTKANKDTKDLIKTLEKTFGCLYFRFVGNKSSITIDEFLNGMENEYKKDAHEFSRKNRECLGLLISCVDVDGDSYLTWQEFKDYVSQAFVIGIDALKNDFIGWNPRVPVKADKVASSIDINNDSKISWEEYKRFRGYCSCSVIGKDTLNILKEYFLDLDPYVTVEELVDAWTTFEVDEKGTENKVLKEMANGIFVQPNELSSLSNKRN